MRRVRFRVVIAILMLFGHKGTAAGASYRVQPVVRRGDRIGDRPIKTDGYFAVSALNDRGQILFVADTSDGNQMLVQTDGDRLLPIAAAGGEAGGRQWGRGLGIRLPVRMNQRGNVLFTADETVGQRREAGTFFWEYAAQRFSPVGLQGMLAGQGLAFDPRGLIAPGLNNRDDLVLAATVRPVERSGAARAGIFFVSRDGPALPVALPDGPLPGGGRLTWASHPSVDDAGRVAFVGLAQGSHLSAPYLWEQGLLTALPVDGVVPPRGLLSLGFDGVWVNNANRNVLATVFFHSISIHSAALYLLSGGAAIPVAIPGQEMPGGGRFRELLDHGVSEANEAGQHAFLARLQDGATAAYQMEADGTVSLILKSGAETSLGRVVSIGRGFGYLHGVGINHQGQVALTLRFDRGPETLVLLTPSA
jgi:hypothetical protein